MKNCRVAILLAICVAATADAATLRVPIDHPDVATALAVAQDGDTVAVAASLEVSGGLVVPGRDLVVLGGWDDAFTTIIGRTPITGAPDAPAMRLEPPATGSPEVAGFAITGGGGAPRSSPVSGRYGGGVLVEGGAPLLRDLIIVGAEAGASGGFGAGGGLALLDTEAVVEDVSITACRAVQGGGIYVHGGAPLLRNCLVTDSSCRALAGPDEPRGAGLAVHLGDLVMTDCEFRGGRGAVRGGGISWEGTRGRVLEMTDCIVEDNTFDLDGGGLYGEAGSVTIVGGRFAANGPSPDAPYTSGGGLYLTGASTVVAGVGLVGNRADAGGGLTVNTAAQADIRDCVFDANEATLFGAALNYQSNEAGEIVSNTMAGNTGPDDAGVLNIVASSPDLARNLVAFNDGQGVALAVGSLAPSCNDVFANSGAAWFGLPDPTGQDGNIAVDPLFCDLPAGDLTLQDTSPCLAPAGCGRIGALDVGCGDDVAVADVPTTGPVTSAYPNPFNPAVTIRTRLAADGPVTVSVHDLRGRLVRMLLNDPRPAGHVEVRWDGRDQGAREVGSGVYVYRVTTGEGTATGRLTLVR